MVKGIRGGLYKMEIRKENIVAQYRLKDGNKYIFLMDKTVYLESVDGELKEIELTQKNIQRIKDNVDIGKTDIKRL